MSENSSSVYPPAFASAPPQRVLFLCVHNSARSQMAEGLARARAPKGVEIWSAGTEPSGVHPLAVQVMDEIGIDIRAHASKGLEEVPWRQADTVVTLCGEAYSEHQRILAGVNELVQERRIGAILQAYARRIRRASTSGGGISCAGSSACR